MARPADWSPVDMDSDPTPGDPREVRTLAEELQTFADDVGQALGRIRGMASDRAVLDWAGLSADAFRREFDGVPSNLTKLQTSYDLCARALDAYWPKLETAQGMADRALDRAIAAGSDLASAQARLDDAEEWVTRAGRESDRLQREGERADVPPPDEADVRAATRDAQAAQSAASAARGQVDAARASLDAARQLAQEALELREQAARECARGIEEASDAGIQNRRWWERLLHWLAEAWDTIVEICKVIVAVLGVVVAIIGGPLAWVVVGAGLVVLGDTLIKYANGEGTLLDIAFAALDCVPGLRGITTVGGLARGARGVRGSAATGLRGQAIGARGLGRRVRGQAREMRGVSARADPVDMATGEVLMSATDVELPGALPLVLERHHRTGVRSGTWFGPSWSSTLDQRLLLDAHGVRLCAEDGMVLYYPRPLPDATVLPVEGPRWELAWHGEPGGTLTVHQRETGRTLHFGPVPGRLGGELPLTVTTDRNGNRVRVEYDESGAPAGIVHDGGYHVGVTVENGRVAELRLLSDPDQPVLRRYGYDAAGNLAQVYASSARPLELSYDHKRRLTGWRDRNDTWYRYVYDERGRCVATEGSGGFLNSAVAYDAKAHRTLFTDSLGNTTAYQFNDAFQLVEETDPLGNSTRRTFDRYDRLTTFTDPLGRTTILERDAHGDVATVVRPDGTRRRAKHNAFGQPTEIVEADGGVWRQTYDERGNLRSVTDPAAATTRHTYDERGRHTSTIDALGNVTRLEHDAAGLTVRTTDPLGAVLAVAHDPRGRVERITGPLGAATSLDWTPEGLPARAVYPDGGVRRWAYDDEGNLLRDSDEAGDDIRFEYGPFDVVSAQEQADGARYSFTRDTELRITRVTNPAGLTWDYTYDAAGRLVAESDFDERRLSYTYDAAGQLTSRTDAAGNVTRYEYDANGLTTAQVSGDIRTRFVHDPVGRITRAVSADADVRLRLDPLGRILEETTNGRTVAHEYDALGRLVATTTPTGHRTTRTYDSAGRHTSLVSDGRVLTFERDLAGRETRRGAPGGISLEHHWDAMGRLGRLTLGVEGRTTLERDYRYARNGYLSEIRDAHAGRTTFQLDPQGRITSARAPGWSERYAYDAAGNLATSDRPAGPPARGHAGTHSHTHTYAGTRVTRVGNTRYAYDAAGRTVLRRKKLLSSGAFRTWRYEWDAEGRLVGVTTPDGTRWRYRHDPFGRRVAKERLDPAGEVVERTDYAWHGYVLIEQSTVAADRPHRTTLTWDHDGARPLAQSERVVISARDAPQEVIDASFHAIVTDLVGTPTELVDASGNVAWRSRATVWGVQPGSESETTTPLRFPGQYEDQETGWHYNVHRHYDPEIGRYTSPDPLGLAPAPDPVSYVRNPHVTGDLIGLSPCTPAGPGTQVTRASWPADREGRIARTYHGLTAGPSGTNRPDDELVLSGHGHVEKQDAPTFIVPEGTHLAMYGRHRDTISDRLGGIIETADPMPMYVYKEGTKLPDYLLLPPTGLTILGGSRTRTVSTPTRLSDLLSPNMGRVHWAACRVER
ncbi:hypothetical protein E1265_08505 [Streptomyces sp. 8K308]|uniref:DUF6531 domain-containing protein n=1 Tax=Streptomyces sp. 8K308 TaxID=2530388 RepID=UPI00104D2B10|nr:DUF6531 domain-containing protein [Streptomyces sp. 8K308]TDC24827.1 hypothetical protein E1265_08505 [Streptomyces sp. 8K308]